MSDQGWMVDDGTCDACMDGWCPNCTKPKEVPVDDVYLSPGETMRICCCSEGQEIL
jgi:hypothetical protein